MLRFATRATDLDADRGLEAMSEVEMWGQVSNREWWRLWQTPRYVCYTVSADHEPSSQNLLSFCCSFCFRMKLAVWLYLCCFLVFRNLSTVFFFFFFLVWAMG